jgi:RNA polymerase sigma-70 factor (ECF subfamily)
VRRTRATTEQSDSAAFGRLFGRHAQAVYAFCARRTADLGLAEDLTSITFLEAWRHRDRLPAEEDGVLPWLLGVANNVVRNGRRSQRRYRAFLERVPEATIAPAAEELAVGHSATEARLRDALEAIATLSRGEQEVVMLVLWSGLSYREAATALSVPVGTVQSRLSRARSKLKIALDHSNHYVLEEA